MSKPVLFAATIAAALCAGNAGAYAACDKMDKVTAAWLPIMQTTAYYVAIEEKLFEKACIEIDSNKMESPKVRVARMSVLLVGILATFLGIVAQGVNVAVLVILGFSIAASANFPVVALSLFWRRFNTGGVIGAVTVGLISSITLALLGPAFLGPNAWSPLVVPTILTMPLGFLGAIVGSLIAGSDRENEERFEEVSVRAHTGLGAEV